MEHPLPSDVLNALDDMALFLAQLPQATVLPAAWQVRAGELWETVYGLTHRPVGRESLVPEGVR